MEFALIDRIRARSAARDDVLLGIGDDAALLRVPAGHDLVVSTDVLNAGVHYPHGTAPADIGWKTLAVNLSDLAAMGAAPAWCTLSLSLPQADAGWLDAFLDGFFELADRHRIALVGGDTTRGPLSTGVTVQGLVPQDQALRRDAARGGDEIWVTGALGDAAAALRGVLDPAAHPACALALPRLRGALDRPQPLVEAGLALRGLAHACIDLSDGLHGDLGHVLRASGVGARIELARLPASEALHAAVPDDEARWALQLAGGDDYELCFTAPPAQRARIEASLSAVGAAACVVGVIDDVPGLRLLRPDGAPWKLPSRSWDHFSGTAR